MHYELAPWLPALCSQVPALAGCCDTSCAVNTLVQVGVSSLICCVCVQIVSLPWCTGSFSKHFGSLLHTGWDSSLLTPALLLPLTVNSLPPGSSFQGWQGISASASSQSTPRSVELQGWQGSGSCICCPACAMLGSRALFNQREEGSLLLPSAEAHPCRPRTQYSYNALPVCNYIWCLADFSCKRLRDREVVVNTRLEMTCCW